MAMVVQDQKIELFIFFMESDGVLGFWGPILDLPLVVVVEAALRVDMRRPPPDRRPPEPGLAAGGGGRLRISLASR